MSPLSPALVRGAVLLIPIAAAALLWWRRRPQGREVTGLVLATMWQLPPLLFLNTIAPMVGWWSFSAEGGLWQGVPVDLLLAWAVLWGLVWPLALPRMHPAGVAVIAVLVDLALIPLCRPVIDLSGRWLLGEGLCVATGLLPGLALARWTAQRRNLVGRAVLQALGFGGISFFLLPAALLALDGGTWEPLLARPPKLLLVLGQLALIPLSMGLAAVTELARRGGGTALPLDPSQRLVSSGPYAYMANPMQLCTAVLLTGEGLLLRSLSVTSAGLMAMVFGAGFASWQEREAMSARFGAPFVAWRAAVRAWLPRWRPWVPVVAQLYYARGCGPCERLAGWLTRARPVGLELVPAQEHPSRDLERMTYNPGDGTPEEEGIAALARALEHINLFWAAIAWLLRLPGVHALAQGLGDGLGFGPRLVRRDLPPS